MMRAACVSVCIGRVVNAYGKRLRAEKQVRCQATHCAVVGAVGDYARGQCSADTGAMSWHAVLQFRGQREWYATRHLSEPAPNAQGLGPRSRVG